MPQHLLLAFTVAFGEQDGGEFDFDRMVWVEKNP
jgi:hypothetical protein